MSKEGAAQEVLGPNLDPEKFLKLHREFANGESTDASNAGERRVAIGAMFDEMRLEPKAAGQGRAILKMKNEGKMRDAVRTWQQLLPMLEDVVLGGSQDEMDLHPANGTAQEAAVDPLDDDEYDPTDFAANDAVAEEDAETAEFNDAVDDAMADNVRPIDFGGATAAE